MRSSTAFPPPFVASSRFHDLTDRSAPLLLDDSLPELHAADDAAAPAAAESKTEAKSGEVDEKDVEILMQQVRAAPLCSKRVSRIAVC